MMYKFRMKVSSLEKLLFIYNPQAGRQKARSSLADILETFSAAGCEVTVYPTKCAGDATRRAADSRGFDRLVCCGGDGTLNETVSGLMTIPMEERPVLGYIPTGSANDFSRNVNLPKTMTGAAGVACGGKPRVIDLGLCDGRYFTYVAAFGLFTEVSYSTPQNTKNLLGHFAYVLEGAGKLTSIPSYRVKVETSDGVTAEGDYIYGMVGNTVSVGGLVKLPKDKILLDDGLFEVILIRKPRSAKDYQDILTALTTQKFVEGGAVAGFTASKVTFTSEKPLSWTLDGEFGGERTVTSIENLPRAVALACGEE